MCNCSFPQCCSDTKQSLKTPSPNLTYDKRGLGISVIWHISGGMTSKGHEISVGSNIINSDGVTRGSQGLMELEPWPAPKLPLHTLCKASEVMNNWKNLGMLFFIFVHLWSTFLKKKTHQQQKPITAMLITTSKPMLIPPRIIPRSVASTVR